jgi:hypothetical protein
MRRLTSLLAVSAFVSALWAQEASSTLQFKFTEKQRELFDATVELNGNLPIPGAAGMAGSLKMMMTVFMEVDKVEDGGKATVKTGLEAFEAEFNGQPFPVGLDMARKRDSRLDGDRRAQRQAVGAAERWRADGLPTAWF